jgi:hypothetical protein
MTKRKKAITANIVKCIEAVRLIDDEAMIELQSADGGGEDFLRSLRRICPQAWDLMKGCTPLEFYEAGYILKDQALWAGKLEEIGKRHHAKRQETMHDLLTRAAAAGDEEAKALIACGLLEQKVY